MISILILTLNEEGNLPSCLASVAWAEDIHVLDSGSTDRTGDIARAAGAHFHIRAFDTWAGQQNWALRNIPFKHPWVFYLDADERATAQLAQAMTAAVTNPGPCVCFKVQRRDFFLDTWLRHVQMTPFYERLFRPDRMSYEREVHPISKPDGSVGVVQGYLDHFPFSKGISDWVKRHNTYSSQEARITLEARGTGRVVGLRDVLLEPDPAQRRRNLKEFYYRLPARPLVKFFYMYIGKLGFLDGRAGLTYSLLLGFYEYLIVLKTEELEAARAGVRESR